MERFKEKICLDGIHKLYIAENRLCKSWAEEIETEKDLLERGLTPIKGKLPGNFELDMERAGLIGDLYYDIQTLEAQKLENRHLWYVINFDFKGKKTDDWYFFFEGVDTVADYYLNGEWLNCTDNMLIPHTIDTEGNLKRGKNELLVHITPAMIEARNRRFDAGCTPNITYIAGSITIRKAASMYGWDIMPRIVSAGIWKSLYLCLDKPDFIDEFYMRPTFRSRADSTCVYINTKLEGDFAQEYYLDIEGVCGNHTFKHTRHMYHTEESFHFNIDNPVLWWPHTMGKPNLYDVKVTLRHFDEVVDTKTLRYGARTVELKRTNIIDDNGKGEFKFLINGQPFSAYGTNWVPMDAFHSRDKERLPKALELLRESGSNIVRCWGGNVYEDDMFFDFCDENGIAVWQDFAMACANYPMDETFCEALRDEAEAVIKRLRHHACLFLWAGDNEVDYLVGGYKDPNTNILTREILPRVIDRLDPMRDYLPSSPYLSPEVYAKKMLPTKICPEYHLWGPRQYYKQEFYRDVATIFASETGYHGCNSPEGIKKFIAPENLWPWQSNDAWLVHSTDMVIGEKGPFAYRIPLMANQIKVLFGDTVPDNLEDFALASQISQSEAKKYFVERYRTGKVNWERTGIIWWNLLDGWPQFSDAVIDYNYYRKLAHFTIMRSQTPTCLMFADKSHINGKIELIALNDPMEEKSVYYKVSDVETGKILLDGTTVLKPNGAIKLAELDATDDAALLLIEYTVDSKDYTNHFLCGKPTYDYAQVRDWLKKANLLTIEGFEKY